MFFCCENHFAFNLFSFKKYIFRYGDKLKASLSDNIYTHEVPDLVDGLELSSES